VFDRDENDVNQSAYSFALLIKFFK
jgi:hypothetical protein